ncbi:TolC family protein [Desulforhopalus sp. 52FAK]
MKPVSLTCLLLFCLLPDGAFTKELEHYLSVLNTHPNVQAILERQESFTYQADGAMGLPDPSLFFGVDNIPLTDPSFDQYLPSAKVIGFSQNIPNSKGRKAQREVFNSSASSINILAEYTKSQLQARFFSRLADLQRIGQQTSHEIRKKRIIAELDEYYEGLIMSGESIYQKTFLTEIQLSEIGQKLNTLMAQKTSVEADLIQLVGEVPEIDEIVTKEKKWNGDLGTLYPVQIAHHDIAIEQSKVLVAGSEYSPDYGIVGTYKIREDGENDTFEGDDWFSIQFRVSIPLWSSNNQGPKLEAAKSRQKSAESKYRGVIRKWQMETVRLQSEQKASLLNVQLLNDKNIAIKKKIAAMERTYSAGQTSLEPILQAELARLSLLSQIDGEKAQYIKITQELSAHVSLGEDHDIQ